MIKKAVILICSLLIFLSAKSADKAFTSRLFDTLDKTLVDSVFLESYADSISFIDSLQSEYSTSSFEYKNLEFKRAFYIWRQGDSDNAIAILLFLLNDEAAKQDVYEIYKALGIIYEEIFIVDKSILYFENALDVIDTTNLKEYSQMVASLGSAYFNQGAFDKALDNFKKSYDVKLMLKDTNGFVGALSNIGLVHDVWGQTQKAIEIYNRALKIALEKQLNYRVAILYSNIGVANFYNEDYNEALLYYNKALRFDKLNEDNIATAGSYHNIGNVYEVIGQYKEALNYYQQALSLEKQEGDMVGMVLTLHDIGLVFSNLGDINLAINYCSRSYNQAMDNGFDAHAVSGAETLSNLYFSKKNFEKAYFYERKYNELSDSFYSKEKTKIIAEKQAQFNSEHQERQLERTIAQKKITIAQLEKSKWLNLFFIVLFFGFFVLFLVGYFLYKTKKQANLKLQQQKIKIQDISNVLAAKNKNFIDSLEYARLVQKAALPDTEMLEKYFSDFAIMNLPHSIVSGDFYWSKSFENKVVVVLADCTGHGVPGGLMSMLGVALLNEIITQAIMPNEVLNKMRGRVKTALHQQNYGKGNNDGMDMACILFDFDKNKAFFSGANSPIICIENGDMKLLKPNKMPISISKNEAPFDVIEFDFSKGDRFILYTDGVVDQFGENGRKFLTKRFKSLILESTELSATKQKEFIFDNFLKWKGNTEQTDDALYLSLTI